MYYKAVYLMHCYYCQATTFSYPYITVMCDDIGSNCAVGS